MIYLVSDFKYTPQQYRPDIKKGSSRASFFYDISNFNTFHYLVECHNRLPAVVFLLFSLFY